MQSNAKKKISKTWLRHRKPYSTFVFQTANKISSEKSYLIFRMSTPSLTQAEFSAITAIFYSNLCFEDSLKAPPIKAGIAQNICFYYNGFILSTISQIVIKLHSQRKRFFSDMWQHFELQNYFLGIYTFIHALHIYSFIYSLFSFNKYLTDPSQFLNMMPELLIHTGFIE